MKQRLYLLREFSVPLLIGVVAAIIWCNLDPAGYNRFVTAPFLGDLTFHFVANELFMVLFFGIAAVEITQSFLPGGSLNPLAKGVNPLLATIGGVVGPAAVYWSLNAVAGSPELSNGWGIPTATDIAFAWLAARALYGASHPAVSYLLLLAVADDAIGLVIIALFYPDPAHPVEPLWLLLTLAGMAVAMLLRRGRINSYWPYVIVCGTLSWQGLHKAHLHPALALALIIPFLPHARRERKMLFEDDPHDRSPLARFEHEWKAVVDVGLLAFGLANAGVQFSDFGAVSFLILAALLIGKCAGVYSFGLLAARLGFPLPRGMKRKELLTVGIIAGTGFTVALFVAGEAFSDPAIRDEARMGALLSLAAAVIGFVSGKLLGVTKETS